MDEVIKGRLGLKTLYDERVVDPATGTLREAMTVHGGEALCFEHMTSIRAG